MKPSELAATLDVAIKSGDATLIVSGPGNGKTDNVGQSCERTGTDLIVTHPVTADETTYRGLPYASRDGKTANWLPYDDLATIMGVTKKTCFFIDDLGQAQTRVQAAIMQLVLSGKINGHAINPELVSFVAATNNPEDLAGVMLILEPLKSRFQIVELDVDVDDWSTWAIAHAIPVPIIAFIRWRPELLCKFVPTRTIKNTPNPRNVAACAKIMTHGYPEHLWFELFEGRCGETWATEYTGFLRVYQNLPDPDYVILHPEQVDIPKDMATLFAMTGALASRANPGNFANVVKFSNRLPDEFNVRLIIDATSHKPGLAKTKAFIDWSIKHQNVVA